MFGSLFPIDALFFRPGGPHKEDRTQRSGRVGRDHLQEGLIFIFRFACLEYSHLKTVDKNLALGF